MSTTQFYDEILADIPDGLERDVLNTLMQHVGETNKITLKALTVEILGDFSSTTERQVREVIERLRRKGVAIISESGKAGRWLAANKSELDACVSEMEARHRNLGEVIRSLRLAQIPARQMKSSTAARQITFWEG